jgi:aspartyl-tRNA(Asn)/glutamyl-tRNA(Gln) amidotransferase subunit A
MIPSGIDEFGRLLRARRISAEELAAECLRRTREQAHLNAYITVWSDDALRQARELDRELAAGLDRGPLHGVPVSLKDLIDVRGTPTTAASRVREGHVADADAMLVGALRRAGVVLVGKTNLHEFAFGTTNEESAYGPARNPHDPERSPGGSSGGSAVSVAAGMALASIGTDTGGSIRIPAAACGVVGLKPSRGEVPLDGVVPLSSTLDHAGPLAADVTDTWHVYQALVGGEEPPPPPTDLRHVQLGIPRDYFLEVVDEEIRQGFDEVASVLTGEGAALAEVRVPHAALIAPIYTHISFAEAAAYHADTIVRAGDRYTPGVRARLETAGYVLAEDYVRARKGRRVLREEVDRALAGRTALLLPTLPIPAPRLGEVSVRLNGRDETVRSLTLRLTQLFNVTGHPAISLPAGRTSSGLPWGVQLVGPRGRTAALVAVARSCELALGSRTH